jgi:hypothetical protein
MTQGDLEFGKQTQEQMILAALQDGRRLTALDALSRFGCFRLASRISALKKAGHPITRVMVTLPSGKHVAQYSMMDGGE